ncbi:MAG: hypothetical protein CFE23_02715 [Flavobacterium sp. BFFFF1]|uniref:carboxypeptidase-like regulatory domain-containing protein n=1 Tax=Flavobacterium sp. BFFFF1 TaxID=2015557 RepID=UPI000BDADE88|nr:carboxypeptidase-like regulatory domain-containing protein [Flavobacterium sp. BFFFF1]OYU81809.1 MAG: hypothetical protein CFE23_02715 [Flavobacterium sp. BFFFF1]
MLPYLKTIATLILFSLCGNHFVSAQTDTANKEHLHTITGRITDQDGFPVPGAMVMINKTGRGVLTDIAGNFSISAYEGELLIVNALSYNKAEIIISTNRQYNISIKQELQGTGPPVIIETFRKRTFFGRIFHAIGNFFRGKGEFGVRVS